MCLTVAISTMNALILWQMMVTFLTRLRKNEVIREVYAFKLHEDTTILSDQIILIATTQNRTENYFRLLRVLDSKGNELQLLTNRFDLSTEDISERYKSCWAIELFFKWVKGSKSFTVKVNGPSTIKCLSH
jgi:putative transposase